MNKKLFFFLLLNMILLAMPINAFCFIFGTTCGDKSATEIYDGEGIFTIIAKTISRYINADLPKNIRDNLKDIDALNKKSASLSVGDIANDKYRELGRTTIDLDKELQETSTNTYTPITNYVSGKVKTTDLGSTTQITREPLYFDIDIISFFDHKCEGCVSVDNRNLPGFNYEFTVELINNGNEFASDVKQSCGEGGTPDIYGDCYKVKIEMEATLYDLTNDIILSKKTIPIYGMGIGSEKFKFIFERIGAYTDESGYLQINPKYIATTDNPSDDIKLGVTVKLKDDDYEIMYGLKTITEVTRKCCQTIIVNGKILECGESPKDEVDSDDIEYTESCVTTRRPWLSQYHAVITDPLTDDEGTYLFEIEKISPEVSADAGLTII